MPMRIDPDRYFTAELDEHQAVLSDTRAALAAPFRAWVEAAVATIERGGKILFFGNGGSAGDAQQLATDLAVRYKADRVPIAALALTTDTSALTAIGNDFGFEHLFARQIDALGAPGDMAVAISTSGKSPNVIRGMDAAAARGLTVVGLTVRDGGDLVGRCDPILLVPSATTARIQEMHISLGQILCGALELALGLVAE